MTLHASPVVAGELARTVLVKNYFYRVRIEAAKALRVVSRKSDQDCAYCSILLLRAITLVASFSSSCSVIYTAMQPLTVTPKNLLARLIPIISPISQTIS